MQICLHEQNTKVIPVNIRSAGTRSCQTGIWTEPSPKGSLSCWASRRLTSWPTPGPTRSRYTSLPWRTMRLQVWTLSQRTGTCPSWPTSFHPSYDRAGPEKDLPVLMGEQVHRDLPIEAEGTMVEGLYRSIIMPSEHHLSCMHFIGCMYWVFLGVKALGLESYIFYRIGN